jgi:uncharacterized protein YbjQ (UPF0145 family)
LERYDVTSECKVCSQELKTAFWAQWSEKPSVDNPSVCEGCFRSRGKSGVAELEAEVNARKEHEKDVTLRAGSMPVTTSYTTAAGAIAEEIDIITSECVFGINIFKDFFGGVRDVVGGRAGAHQKVLKDLRKTCLDELRMNAAEIGADAVIGVDLDYSEISGGSGGLLMLVASGTAVKLEPKRQLETSLAVGTV